MTIIHYDDLDDNILKEFNLRHINEDDLIISRCKKGKGFCFYDGNGKLIDNEKEKQRLLSLAVPPAYTDVLYAPYKNAHIQAVGCDSSQKKQYFYHEEWSIIRDITKFGSLAAFGKKLPSFRRKITQHLKDEDTPKKVIIAAMFRILDQTGIRIGSAKSTKANKTYGLTTLKPNQVEIEDGQIELHYIGKGGVEITQTISDRFITDILEECSELSGQTLFQHEGGLITSTHINQTIKNHFGETYSAKDFRTWRFSCLFLDEILKANKRGPVVLKNVFEKISKKTGNTPAVLQSSYIHPGLVEIAKTGDFEKLETQNQNKAGLRKCEAVFLRYLETDHATESLMRKAE